MTNPMAYLQVYKKYKCSPKKGVPTIVSEGVPSCSFCFQHKKCYTSIVAHVWAQPCADKRTGNEKEETEQNTCRIKANKCKDRPKGLRTTIFL